jgi:hypothetical protein
MKKLEKKMKRITIRIESRDIDSEGNHSESKPEGAFHTFHHDFPDKNVKKDAIIYSLKKYIKALSA